MSHTSVEKFTCDSCTLIEDMPQDPHMAGLRKPEGWTRVVPTTFGRAKVPSSGAYFDLCADCSKEWHGMMDSFLEHWGKP